MLAAPVLKWLAIQPDGTYVDCTAGAGGHSELIAQSLSGGRLLALDRDPTAVELVRKRLASYPSVRVAHANYAHLATVLHDLGIGPVQGILIDAGVSSMQIDDPKRGFSLQHEGPLDMRMNPAEGMTALEYLATTDPDELTRVLRSYGDVGPARRIAKLLSVRAREGRIRTTLDLVRAVQESLSFVRGIPDEVRTVFQAIRIAVNDELAGLAEGVHQAIECLAPGGRLAVISFHSGEDRIVKSAFNREGKPQRELHPDGRLKREIAPRLKILTRKPTIPDAREVCDNPRAHSARLRVAERVSEEPAS